MFSTKQLSFFRPFSGTSIWNMILAVKNSEYRNHASFVCAKKDFKKWTKIDITLFQSRIPPVDLYLIFEKSSLTNWIFSLQKSISKLIFAGYTGSKNPVRNRQKIQFVELDFSKLIFQKSSTDQQGVSFTVNSIL